MTTTQHVETLAALRAALQQRSEERVRTVLAEAPAEEISGALDELTLDEQARLADLVKDAPEAAVLARAEPDPEFERGAAALAHEGNPLRRLLQMLGPGLVTGAADDDPSGIATYAVAGASLGFATLWTALITFPLMTAVQFVCAKIGLASGMGLAGVLRQHYPRWLLCPTVLALLVANTLNAGADLGAIAAAINLFVPVPIPVLVVPVTLVVLVLQLWAPYWLIARVFKWLTLALLAYIGSALFAHPEPGAVLLGTLVPAIRFDREYLSTLVAILGTTISPYLFFWQASHYMEEQVAKGRIYLWQRRASSRAELRYAAWDVTIGMLASNLVMYFIIMASAATLFANGQTEIRSAAEAAQALRPLAGDAAGVLLAVGLIGSGLLAVPVLTSSSAYALAEAFSWRSGLGNRLARARRFYAVIVASTLVGVLFNFLGINPIDALVWVSIVNGFLAPPLMAMLLLVANNRRVMGRWTNGRLTNALGWLATLAMGAATIGLVAIGASS